MATLTTLKGTIGEYEIVRPEPVIIGRVSVFYAGVEKGTGREVLVKSFQHQKARDYEIDVFYREVDTLSKLEHPNILKIIDFSAPTQVDGYSPFLVVPWCRNGSLSDYMRRQHFLSLESALPLLRQIAAAIDYSHQHGVIHGDIKPQNVLVSENSQKLFLTDFGMAKYFDIQDRVQTMPGAGGGSSAYLSPEQLKSRSQTPLSDIYSFALLAYEMITGRLPFEIDAPLYNQLRARIEGDLLDPAMANPSIPEFARDALKCGLAVEPGARPRTATALCDLMAGTGTLRPTARTDSRDKEQHAGQGNFWSRLDTTGRVAVITGAIAALSAIAVAMIQVLPAILGK